MEARQFDQLARALATGMSRRRAIRAAAGVVAAKESRNDGVLGSVIWTGEDVP
jgi:hypothetical protein